MASAELNAVVSQRMEVSPGSIILQVVPDDFEVHLVWAPFLSSHRCARVTPNEMVTVG